jgi:Protein kinase domain
MIKRMNVSHLHPEARQAPPPAGAGVLQWLDALAAGACTQEEFLGKVQSLEGNDPELPWEVLALLDQHLRRERISRDVYASLKARLQQRFMGFGGKPQDIAPTAPPKVVPAAARSDHALMVGDVLRGRYQLVDVLRRTPSVALFEAIDQFKVDVPDVSHRVVIEVFDKTHRADPGLLQRICRLQALSHPGIERIFEVDEERGALFLVMESLGGVSLQQLVEQGSRLTLPAARTIIRNVASALSYAHLHNVFHGDVRAENVFITDAGEVRLRGFEIRVRDVPANPKGDRLAFSWFAYDLLSGLRAADGEPVDDRNVRSRAPSGVTREQWRAMRATMLGRERSPGNVLSAFADGSNPVGPVVLLQENARARAKRLGISEWMASGVVAVILGVAGYFVVTRGMPTFPQQTSPPVAGNVPVPRAVTPTAEFKVDAPGPATEVAAATVAPVAAPPVAAPGFRRALIDLPSETRDVPGDQPVAKIWVRRRDGLRGEVSFVWWTESGSAKVDRDYRQISPRTAVIDAGASGVELLVPLLDDPSRQQPRTFYVKIDEPGPGATLGDRTLMQVSIVPPGFVAAP